jgi:ribonuclease HI
VVDALLSNTKNNELDISAAIRALSDAGDALLITVEDASQHVRIWVDSKNASE